LGVFASVRRQVWTEHLQCARLPVVQLDVVARTGGACARSARL